MSKIPFLVKFNNEKLYFQGHQLTLKIFEQWEPNVFQLLLKFSSIVLKETEILMIKLLFATANSELEHFFKEMNRLIFQLNLTFSLVLPNLNSVANSEENFTLIQLIKQSYLYIQKIQKRSYNQALRF